MKIESSRQVWTKRTNKQTNRRRSAFLEHLMEIKIHGSEMIKEWTWTWAWRQINHTCITATISFYKRELRASNYLTIIIVFLMSDTHRSLTESGDLCDLCPGPPLSSVPVMRAGDRARQCPHQSQTATRKRQSGITRRQTSRIIFPSCNVCCIKCLCVSYSECYASAELYPICRLLRIILNYIDCIKAVSVCLSVCKQVT